MTVYRCNLGSFEHTQVNDALHACELVYSCTEFYYIFMSSSTLELVNIVINYCDIAAKCFTFTHILIRFSPISY